MPLKSAYITLISILCFLLACHAEKASSPEEVARKWQEYVDNNQFDQARQLSTSRAQEMVRMMEGIFLDEEDMISTNTQFKSMNCKERGDTMAICVYEIIDEEELIRDSFTLIKFKEQWLVDIPEEEGLMEEEDVEKLFNEFEQILNNALEEDNVEKEEVSKQ